MISNPLSSGTCLIVLLSAASRLTELAMATPGNVARLPSMPLSHRVDHNVFLSSLYARGTGTDRVLQENSNVSTAPATDEATCSEDPFLWLIQKDQETVGFAVGTMHFPQEIVVSDSAWASLLAATEDACAVYGEVDLTDEEIMSQIETCSTEQMTEYPEELATLETLSEVDADLAEQYTTVIREIAQEYFPQTPTDTLVNAFRTTLSLDVIMQLALAHNTPVYNEAFFKDQFSPEESNFNFLDADLMERGRPSAGLETVDEVCNYSQALTATKDTFIDNYETLWAPQLEVALTSNYTQLVTLYKCGNTQNIEEFLMTDQETSPMPQDWTGALLDDRDALMAERMVTILESTTERPMFAVGLAHWIYGESNLEVLLNNEGYTLQRVKGAYDPQLLPEVSDETCRSQADINSNVGESSVNESSGATVLSGTSWISSVMTLLYYYVWHA